MVVSLTQANKQCIGLRQKENHSRKYFCGAKVKGWREIAKNYR